jgi:hypothetical protein
MLSSKWIGRLFKITGASLIFIAPLVYLYWKYKQTETYTVEVTDTSLPMVITILLSVILIFGISWLFSQTKAYINDNPFGYGSIIFFGGLLGAVSFIGMMWLSKIEDLINANVGQFLIDLATYKHSIWIVLAYVISGIVVAISGFIIEKTA